MRRLFGFLRESLAVGMAGAFTALLVLRLGEDEPAPRLLALALGWFYALLVRVLLRLFRVVPWAYPILGLVVGPVPVALLVGPETTVDERQGALAATALFGVMIGLIEWASVAHRGRATARPGASDRTTP